MQRRRRLWARRSFPNSSSRYKARTGALTFPLSWTDHVSSRTPAAHCSCQIAHAFSHSRRTRALTFGVSQLLHALDGCRSEPALVWDPLRSATEGLEAASHHAALLARAT